MCRMGLEADRSCWLLCRVGGALEGLCVRQVECGLNLTVALTVDGRVWQMGETGVPAAEGPRVLGARTHVPVQARASIHPFTGASKP